MEKKLLRNLSGPHFPVSAPCVTEPDGIQSEVSRSPQFTINSQINALEAAAADAPTAKGEILSCTQSWFLSRA